jgi:hypothetical protein
MFADVAWNEGNLADKQQPGFHWSNCGEIWYAGLLWISEEDLQTWLQSSKITEHRTRNPTFVLFLLLALNRNFNHFPSWRFSVFQDSKVE